MDIKVALCPDRMSLPGFVALLKGCVVFRGEISQINPKIQHVGHFKTLFRKRCIFSQFKMSFCQNNAALKIKSTDMNLLV